MCYNLCLYIQHKWSGCCGKFQEIPALHSRDAITGDNSMTSRELIYLSSGQNSVLNIFPKMCLVWPECIHVHDLCVPLITFCNANLKHVRLSTTYTRNVPFLGKDHAVACCREIFCKWMNLHNGWIHTWKHQPHHKSEVLLIACLSVYWNMHVTFTAIVKKNNFTACNKLL